MNPFESLASTAARVNGYADLEAVYRLVDLVYETVEHPDQMTDALAALAELTGAGSVLLLAIEGQERRLVAAGRAPLRIGEAGTGAVHVRSDRTRTIPLGVGFELVLDQDELAPRARAAIVRLVPHLGRALRLAERLGSAERGDPGRLGALERLPLAVLFLDRGGRPIFLTHAARPLLASATSIQLEDHRLIARNPVSRALLETLLERVLSAPTASRSFVGGHLTLADDTWNRIDLLVAPCCTQIEKSEIRAVVFLSAPGCVKSPEALLQERYALGADEARTLGRLLAGQEPDGGDGPGGARALVDALYRKLGTTRQSDLVRLLLRPPGVVFESEAQRSRRS